MTRVPIVTVRASRAARCLGRTFSPQAPESSDHHSDGGPTTDPHHEPTHPTLLSETGKAPRALDDRRASESPAILTSSVIRAGGIRSQPDAVHAPRPSGPVPGLRKPYRHAPNRVSYCLVRALTALILALTCGRHVQSVQSPPARPAKSSLVQPGFPGRQSARPHTGSRKASGASVRSRTPPTR